MTKEILELINTVLTREGIDRVITASTARDGLTKFHQEQPDLVILDIMLPDGEGYDICRQIRDLPCSDYLFISKGRGIRQNCRSCHRRG